MRSFGILLTVALALAGCKPEQAVLTARPVRTVVVDPKPILDDRQAGEAALRERSVVPCRR
jgi:hypothetical protein